MSQFNMVITDVGAALLAAAEAGSLPLTFTHMALGSGSIGAGDPDSQTALVTQQQIVAPTSVVASGASVTVRGDFSNAALGAGYAITEIGLFANDGGGDVLYAYGNAAALSDYMPAGGGADIVQLVQMVVIGIGTAGITPVLASGIYATLADLYAATACYHIDQAGGGATGTGTNGVTAETNWETTIGFGWPSVRVGSQSTLKGGINFQLAKVGDWAAWYAGVRLSLDFTNSVAAAQPVMQILANVGPVSVAIRRHSDNTVIDIGDVAASSTGYATGAAFTFPALNVGDYTLYIFLANDHTAGDGLPALILEDWFTAAITFKPS